MKITRDVVENLIFNAGLGHGLAHLPVQTDVRLNWEKDILKVSIIFPKNSITYEPSIEERLY